MDHKQCECTLSFPIVWNMGTTGFPHTMELCWKQHLSSRWQLVYIIFTYMQVLQIIPPDHYKNKYKIRYVQY